MARLRPRKDGTLTTRRALQKPRNRPTKAALDAGMALDLAAVPLAPDMAAYFAKCEEKIGFVPNVLLAIPTEWRSSAHSPSVIRGLGRRRRAYPNRSAK